MTAAAPDCDYTCVIERALAVAAEVLGDRAVWAEEAARTGAAPLPWPLQRPGQGYAQLLRNMAENIAAAAVEAARAVACADRFRDDPVSWQAVRLTARELDPSDAAIQCLLRVVKRAVDAADHVMVAEFGGQGRLEGKAAFKQWANKVAVDGALAAGFSVTDAAAAMGCSPETLYKLLRRDTK